MNNKPFHFFFCVLGVFVAFAVCGQTNFLEGFIVKQGGDTVRGFIDYRNWNKNPSTGRFAINKSSTQIETYQPKDLQALGIHTSNGIEVYRSFNIQYITGTDRVSALTTDPEPHWDTMQVFLLLLRDGKIALYKYSTPNERIHFFIGNDSNVNELVYYRYYEDNQLITRMDFRQQLKDVITDCPAVNSINVQAIRYNEKDLSDVVERYNACQNSNSYSLKSEKNKLHFYLLGGPHYTIIANDGFPPEGIMNIPATVNGMFGLSAEIMPSRHNRQVAFYIETMVKQQNHTGKVTMQETGEAYAEYTAKMQVTYFQLNALCRFFIQPLKTNKPFFQIGFTNNTPLNMKNEMTMHHVFFTTETIKTEPAKRLSRKNEVGATASAGFQFGRSSIQLRGTLSNGYASTVGLATNVKTIAILYGFRL